MQDPCRKPPGTSLAEVSKDINFSIPSSGDSTACLAFVPFQDMLKRVYDGQVKLAGLLTDLCIAISLHEELRSFDAKRYLIEGVQSLFPNLFEVYCRLCSISVHHQSSVHRNLLPE